jgi:cytoskeleton protein RodZ
MTEQTNTEEQVSERSLPVGKILAAARAEQGLSADTIAARLCLAESYISAIETGNYEALPGDTFVRGYLRNYADIVGLNGEELVRIYQEQRAPTQITESTNGLSGNASSTKKGSALFAVAIVLVLVVVLVSLFGNEPDSATMAIPEKSISTEDSVNENQVNSSTLESTNSLEENKDERFISEEVAPEVKNENEVNPSVTTNESSLEHASHGSDVSGAQELQSSEISQSTESELLESVNSQSDTLVDAVSDTTTSNTAEEIEPPVLAKDELTFRFHGVCWYQVIDAKGTLLAERTKSAGDVSTISGYPPFKITLGDSTVVDVTHNGNKVDLSAYFERKSAWLTVGN